MNVRCEILQYFLLCSYALLLVSACNESDDSVNNPADFDIDAYEENAPGDEDISDTDDEEADVESESPDVEGDEDAIDCPEEAGEEEEADTDAEEVDESSEQEEYADEIEIEVLEITGVCDDVTTPDGVDVCMERVNTEEDWSFLTLTIQEGTQIRGTKYFLPADSDARLPALVMNINAVLWHYDLLSSMFSQLFPDLMLEEYNMLVYAGEERELLVGTLIEHQTADLATHYVFSVWDDPSREDWALTCAQLKYTYALLSQMFTLGPVEFEPYTVYQTSMLLSCPDVPIFIP